jgi:urease accessory protein
VTRCAGQVPLACRIVAGPPGRARVALVQTAASILSGDRVEVDVEVGGGASLELLTLGATVAYPAHVEAAQDLAFRVGEQGRFAWLPQPLVLADGCELVSTTEVELADGAAAVLRELYALGRHDEAPGRCRSTLRCDLDGLPLLRDSIAIDPAAEGSPIRLGDARAYGTLALLGIRDTAGHPPGQLALEGPGSLFRSVGTSAVTVERALEPVERSYLSRLWA